MSYYTIRGLSDEIHGRATAYYHAWERNGEPLNADNVHGRWDPFEDLTFNTGRVSRGAVRNSAFRVKPSYLTEDSKRELQKLWCKISPKNDLEHHILGPIGLKAEYFPLISSEMKLIFEKYAPDDFEYVQVDRHWVDKFDHPITDGPMYLANLVTRVDGWDHERTHFTFSESNPHAAAGVYLPNAVVNGASVSGRAVWRDMTTKHLLMCEEMVADIETLGGVFLSKVKHEISH